VPWGECGAKIRRFLHLDLSRSSIVTECNTDVLSKEGLEWKERKKTVAHNETFKSTSLEKNETLETCRAPRIPEKSGEAIELELLKQTDYHG